MSLRRFFRPKDPPVVSHSYRVRVLNPDDHDPGTVFADVPAVLMSLRQRGEPSDRGRHLRDLVLVGDVEGVGRRAYGIGAFPGLEHRALTLGRATDGRHICHLVRASLDPVLDIAEDLVLPQDRLALHPTAAVVNEQKREVIDDIGCSRGRLVLVELRRKLARVTEAARSCSTHGSPEARTASIRSSFERTSRVSRQAWR